VVLVVLCTLVAVGFVSTRAAAGANRALRLRDATAWYEARERHLAGGRTQLAIRALRPRDGDQSRVPRPIADAVAEMFAAFNAGMLTPQGDRSLVGTTPIDEFITEVIRGGPTGVAA
jgi:hypothetical protein